MGVQHNLQAILATRGYDEDLQLGMSFGPWRLPCFSGRGLTKFRPVCVRGWPGCLFGAAPLGEWSRRIVQLEVAHEKRECSR